MPSYGNPWKIQSLYELQYFNCPACHYKNRSNQEFINHAYETHPESIEDLKNITDASMDCVVCPWDNVDIKDEVSDNDFFDSNVPENDSDISIEDTVSQNIHKDRNVLRSRRRNVQQTNYYEGDETEENTINGASSTSTVKEKKITCILCKIYQKDPSSCNHAKISVSSSSIPIEQNFKGKKKNNMQLQNHEIISPNSNEEDQKAEKDLEVLEEIENSYTNNDDPYPNDADWDTELVSHSETHQSTDNNDQKSQYKCNYCKKNNIENSACLLCKLFQKNKTCDYIKILANNREKFKNLADDEQTNTDDTLNNGDVKNDSDSEDKNSSSENSFNNVLKTILKSKPKPNVRSMTMITMQKQYGLKCKLCGEAFEDKNLLRNHLVTNHRNTCPLCKESFDRNSDLQDHMKAMHEAFEGRKSDADRVKHLCHLCSKIFKKPSALKVHIDSIHYKIRDHTCDSCGKAFINSHKLRYHIERDHENIKNFLCDMCDKQFYFNADLTKHKKSVHGEKKFICRHCGKPFATVGRQKTHEEIVHEGIKNYNCKLCEKKFSTSTLLKRHMKKSNHNHQEIQHISV